MAEIIARKRSLLSKDWRVAAPISLALHLAFLAALSFLVFQARDTLPINSMLSLVIGKNDPLAEAIAIQVELPAPSSPESADDRMALAVALPEMFAPVKVAVSTPSFSEFRDSQDAGPAPQQTTSKAAPARKAAAKTDPGEEPQFTNHLAGRSAESKADLVQRMGGTPSSEAAVARGLAWLNRHQLPDGSWSFYHLHDPECNCTMPGGLANSQNGATGMALLCFLGAGYTHRDGPYQDQVRRGLDYLLRHGVPAEQGICFYCAGDQGPGTFYTQALVTLALSEALAMTGDDTLRPAVEGSIQFIAASQHSAGGWRYVPGQAGDTSVVAWQVMALKSAQFSRVTVPDRVLRNVNHFLASVQSSGSQYGYLPGRGSTGSMTAAGVLSRMYLGWRSNAETIKGGARYLSKYGPALDDMYYNYYATQVMHHWGGPEWDRWNLVMRELLVQSQIRGGHADGSWDVADRHGGPGGRLYMTALCILTLEVYYRHLPLYQRDRIEMPLVGDPKETAASVTK